MKMVKLLKCVFVFFFLVNSPLIAEMDYILCIDGGGSKTSVQLLDSNGQLIQLNKNNSKYEKIELADSNINTIGKEGVRTAFASLFNEYNIDDSTPLAKVLSNCQVVAGMAGVAVPQSRQNVLALFEEFGIKNEQVILMNDAELALKLFDNQGVVLISGTGSVCFGKKENTVYRVGGLGKILGDEGSGHQIGLLAIKAALADQLGWGTATSLTPALKEYFNLAELNPLIPQINSNEIPAAKIAGVAPIVFKEASLGDVVADEVINHAANELANLIVTQLKISNVSDCEIHLYGGTFKNAYADTLIKKIMSGVDANKGKNLKVVNKSSENAAVSYATKFVVTKQ